jgi:hypothetical protein
MSKGSAVSCSRCSLVEYTSTDRSLVYKGYVALKGKDGMSKGHGSVQRQILEILQERPGTPVPIPNAEAKRVAVSRSCHSLWREGRVRKHRLLPGAVLAVLGAVGGTMWHRGKAVAAQRAAGRFGGMAVS